jgi:hypothetical protein
MRSRRRRCGHLVPPGWPEFASTSIPWLQLVFPLWVLLVSINIVVLSYRTAD